MKEQTIQLDDRSVTIKKLPLYQYAEVMKHLNELPGKIDGLAGKTNDDIFRQLPAIIGQSIPEVTKILSIATPLDETDIAGLGLDDVVKLAIAVYEVNNYRGIYEQLKKASGRQDEKPVSRPK